jgi:hypothetical protein
MANKLQDEWVTRALGVAIAVAGADAPDRSKLLQRWITAWSEAEAAITGLGSAILALPEVKADPRLEQARAAVGLLPTLLPQFGNELESQLEQQDGGDQALAIVASYRQRLTSAAALNSLEAFAQKHVGALGARATLDGALAEIEQGLQRGAA